MNQLNYAREYEKELVNAFPYALHYGALYGTPNNGRFRYKGGKKIELPTIKTTGRTAGNRDAVPTLARNYENGWEEKTLSNERRWSTLVHPADVDETNGATSIANITKVFNDEHKFPEMDAYCISKIYADYIDAGETPTRATLTSSNVLTTFDTLMKNMTENLVPSDGRILYVTPEVKNLIVTAGASNRVQHGTEMSRNVTAIDGVKLIEVPSKYMKTLYDFSSGVVVDDDAEQINMLLIHPEAVITPVYYQYSCLDEPTAVTGGKYVYYEESFEDVFVLENRLKGIAFVLPPISTGNKK